ncbi:hypothetical protein J3R30DRAFT_3706962, partial [Lentinula aciculospora]
MATDVESEAAPLVANNGKGKGKAHDVTERTPLFASGSSISLRTEDSTPPAQRRRLVSIIVVLAWSYSSRASDMSPDDILHKALGIWVNVEGRIGLDAGAVVGINSDPGDGVLDKIWKSLGRWGVRNLDTVSVWTSTINVTTRSDPPIFLASVDIPGLQISLTVDPPTEHTWLQHMSIPVHIRATAKTSDLLHFAQESWRNGQVIVQTEMSTVDVRGGDLDTSNWKRRLHRQLANVETAFSLKVPELPGFPHPGRNAPIPPLADLVTLQSFQLAN